MKPGERPLKGVKELVLKLAGSNPRPTNKGIREVVKRTFEDTVELSDRTIARYCEKAGLPTSSRLGQPGIGSVDPLRTERRREHSNHLRGQLKCLMAYINVRPPGEVFLRYRKGEEFLYPVGEITISGSRDVAIQQAVCVRLKIRNGGINVSPDIENSPDWKLLLPHLEGETAPAIVGDYAQWKEGLGHLFSLCCSLLLDIATEADKRINGIMHGTAEWEGVRTVWRWGERGIGKQFYEDIYFLVAAQPRWDREECRTEPAAQSGLVALCRSNRGLAIGTAVEVNAYRRVHESLRNEALNWPQKAELVEEYRDCEQRTESLRRKLKILELRGDFKGVCDICRPWHNMQIRQ